MVCESSFVIGTGAAIGPINADLDVWPHPTRREVIVQEKRALERRWRALEGLPEDPDEDRSRIELREGVTHALGSRHRVVLEAALLESWGGRDVVVGPERDCQDVCVVRALVGRHPSFLRLDRRHTFLAELDSLFGDVPVGEEDVGLRFPTEQDVQLRESEAERVISVEKRDANVVGERVGESCRQLQASEAGPKDHDVCLVHLSRR